MWYAPLQILRSEGTKPTKLRSSCMNLEVKIASGACIFSSADPLFHLQDSVITVVAIQAKVKTQFSVTAEQVSPMSINPLGCLEHRFFTQKVRVPSVCLLEILHISDSTHCCGLGVNLGAYTIMGVKFRAHINLAAVQPTPPTFLTWVLEPGNGPASSSLVSSLQKGSVFSLAEEESTGW